MASSRVTKSTTNISIHAPSRERHQLLTPILSGHQFQSTLPRGSDRILDFLMTAYPDFNPRSLAGATLSSIVNVWKPKNFNPRSLAGATRRKKKATPVFWDFNPRSLAGATDQFYSIDLKVQISIHAPSRERRRIHFKLNLTSSKFQSTLPRGSDAELERAPLMILISIHAPSRERPQAEEKSYSRFLDFNPRSLAGATFSFLL